MHQNIFRGFKFLVVLWLSTVAAVAVVLAATLFPFSFEFRNLSFSEYFHSFRYFPSSFRDLPENVLLFAPLGYCVAGLLSFSRGAPSTAILFRVSYIGFGLTLLVETLQIFLPTRTPNVSDLLANTSGALLGASFFQLLRLRLPWKQQLSQGLSCRFGTILLLFFFALGALFLSFLAWGMHPRNWDSSYKLSLANELTGDRSWHGSVSDLTFMDTGVTVVEAGQILTGSIPADLSTALLAHYQLAGSPPFLDSTGKSPPLISASIHNSADSDLGRFVWLLAEAPLEGFNARVNQTGQFTVTLAVSSSSSSQFGPARIVTISENASHRNLTLGQEGNDLVVRWRSPFQGRNGASAQVCFPGVFKSNVRQRLALVFSSTHLALFQTNSEPVSLPITPALGFSALLHEDQTHSVFVGNSHLRILDFTLSALALAPCSVILGLIRSTTSLNKVCLFLLALLLALLQVTIVAALGKTALLWSNVPPAAAIFFVLTGLILHLRRILEAERSRAAS